MPSSNTQDGDLISATEISYCMMRDQICNSYDLFKGMKPFKQFKNRLKDKLPLFFLIFSFANLVLLPISSVSTSAKVISGPAVVVDGDTLIISNTKIRLNAIDAPETDQPCLDRLNKLFSCVICSH
jgi:endonuclease YncB( thermonuclease family)